MAKQATSREHIFIPKHSKVSAKEKKELLEKYNINVNELPSIKKSDPGIVDLDVSPGDVIKIERDSPTAGKTVFFRGVIDE